MGLRLRYSYHAKAKKRNMFIAPTDISVILRSGSNLSGSTVLYIPILPESQGVSQLLQCSNQLRFHHATDRLVVWIAMTGNGDHPWPKLVSYSSCFFSYLREPSYGPDPESRRFTRKRMLLGKSCIVREAHVNPSFPWNTPHSILE